MKTIYKYELQLVDDQEIQFPGFYEILSVQIQAGKACLWVKIDTDEEKRNCYIEIFGTGNPIKQLGRRKFIGTIQFPGLVFHVFEYLGL